MDYHQHFERNLCPKKQHHTTKLLQLPGNITWHILMDKTNIIQLWIRKLQWTLTNEPDHVHDPLRADLHLDFTDFRNPRADFTDHDPDHFPIAHDIDHDPDLINDILDHDPDPYHDTDLDHHFDENIRIHDHDDLLHTDPITEFPNHDLVPILHGHDPKVHDDFRMLIVNILAQEVRDDLLQDAHQEARADLIPTRKQHAVHLPDIAKTKVVLTAEKKTIFRKIAHDAPKSQIPHANSPTSQMRTITISYLLCKICR